MNEAKKTAVAFEHVSKSFGGKQVLRDVTFSVAREETICLLGRSGTGKSVSLKLMIALVKPEAGHVWIDGEDITQLKGQELSRVRRKMGFLFQNAALFDFLNLYDNLALPLRRSLTNRTRRLRRPLIAYFARSALVPIEKRCPRPFQAV